MAKTLGKLRQQTVKLKDLQPPSDVSRATKNFVKKHVYVVHPDANENGDDVFNAKNVKKAKRWPDHGYETGQDKDVYEDFDRVEYHKTQADIHNRYADAVEKKDPGKAIAYRELARKHTRQAARHARFHDSVTMKKGLTRGDALSDDHRASRRMEGQRLRDRMRHEETEIDEVFGLSKKEKAKKAVKAMMDNPRSPWKKAKDAMDTTSSNRYWGKKKVTEGFEHVEALSEKDQAVLVDTYNSLTEENQERFLELAETAEGVDRLLDFAITNKGIA